MVGLTDEELMRAVQAGDEAAFALLYRRYERRLLAFLVPYVGDTAFAEDLLQETFLRVFRQRASYEPRAPLRTWLYAIARNLALDQFRRRRSHRESASPLGEETQVGRDPERLPDPAPDALGVLTGREAATALRAALLDLPEEDRAVILLSRLEGLRYREIAEILGSTEGAVKVRAHRALLALRKRLRRETM
ncbi:MAG: sigma-70 family RNA polymerase sigma factor [candidate division NC10 bacterium]|nr:sigma-70 family RNA polymerase sigma factor [candidate division NC10 bacterium]